VSRKRLLPALPAGMPLPPGISAEELAALMQDAPEHEAARERLLYLFADLAASEMFAPIEAALNAQGFRIPRENAQSRRRERRSLAREG
jgi:hypothetical protein